MKKMIGLLTFGMIMISTSAMATITLYEYRLERAEILADAVEDLDVLLHELNYAEETIEVVHDMEPFVLDMFDILQDKNLQPAMYKNEMIEIGKAVKRIQFLLGSCGGNQQLQSKVSALRIAYINLYYSLYAVSSGGGCGF